MNCRPFMCLLVLPAIIALSSCGSSNTSTSVNPAPTAPTSTPPPSNPNPSPTPSPTPAPDSYLATIICCSVGKTQSAEGQITLDTSANNGAGNVQIVNNGGNIPANESMVLQFCPFPQNFMNCMNVTSLTTDSNGKANVNFTFSQKGTFSGVFQFVSNGNQFLVTASGTSDGINFKAAELPAGSVSGGIGSTTGNAPGSGTIAVTGTTPHLVLSGTLANHTFQLAKCAVNGTCIALGSVMTDAGGNASADVGAVQAFDATLFEVSDSAGVQFISAFRVQ